jgi:hypothetical protein
VTSDKRKWFVSKLITDHYSLLTSAMCL